MGQILDEMTDVLIHYGMPRRSGRYPWGSGEDPYQRTRDFLGRIEELKKQGLSEVEIAKEMGIVDKYGKPSTGKLRTQKKLATNDRRILQIETAERLRDKEGLGPTEIGRKMGLPESTVRSLLNEKSKERTYLARNTADFIKEQIDKKGMIDVGVGVERELGISKEQLNAALALLEVEGYPTYGGRVEQATNKGAMTTMRVACPPGTRNADIYDTSRINSLNEYASHDGGETFDKLMYPKSLDSKRLKVLLGDESGPDGLPGTAKDGIIEIRRGVPDLSLGNDHYSQVRILVDNNKYLKGMAVYSDNLPDGVDILFNSNKTDRAKALKDITSDPDNPFGALIKPNGQSYYTDADGNRQLSLINKTRGEGDWTEWKDSLPSQFLGKQSLSMVKKQLGLAKADKLTEYEDICSLTNPTVKKHYLEKFADECDSAAVHLQAAALPGQKYHVIIPMNTLKETEVYAPRYPDGTKLALIRYPHGGTFEIPILTVNNKDAVANRVIGKNSFDAIGITKANADRLSGADFDGDTVMCIPTHDPKGRVRVTSTPPLKGLEGFDPKMAYGYSDEEIASGNARLMTKANTQKQMGVVSNLITDMTLVGANSDDLAKAVRHSMVVIDAYKHKLNYKQSEIDNEIDRLKKEYQISVDADGNYKYGGASTILSRAKGEATALKTQGSAIIDPETGKKSYKLADDLYYPDWKRNKDTNEITINTTDGKKIRYDASDKAAADKYRPVKNVDPDTGEVYYTDKSGKIRYKTEARTQKSTQMAETDDAHTLVSMFRNPKELAYADYANDMKALANKARKEMMATQDLDYDPSAAKVYANEVSSLNAKLNNALLNAPRERMAQIKTNAEVKTKLADYKDKHGEKMPASDEKKLRQQTLNKYRSEVGSIKRRDRSIEITDREWEAIQSGAVRKSTLRSILNNTDVDNLRQRAMPKANNTLSATKLNKLKSMNNSNYSINEIARALNVSPTTVAKYLKGVNVNGE